MISALPSLPDLPDGPSLETARGPVEIPLLEPWQFWALVLAGAVLLVLFGGWLWRTLRRRGRRAEEDAVPPRQAALAALALAAGREDPAGFGALCAEALRGYCRTALGAGRHFHTTAEILRDASRNPHIAEDAHNELRALLGRYDALKFARGVPTSEERTELLERATHWVEAREAEGRAREEAARAAARESGSAAAPS